jgi:hypothetical protein
MRYSILHRNALLKSIEIIVLMEDAIMISTSYLKHGLLNTSTPQSFERKIPEANMFLIAHNKVSSSIYKFFHLSTKLYRYTLEELKLSLSISFGIWNLVFFFEFYLSFLNIPRSCAMSRLNLSRAI